MIKFKIDEKEYDVPEIMTIENYSKIFKIKDLFSDEYFTAKLVSIVTGAPVEDLLQGDYEQVNYIGAYILSQLPTEFSFKIFPSLEQVKGVFDLTCNSSELTFSS